METVAAYWEHFAETRGRRLTNATLSRYAHSMGKHVLPELGGVALRDLRHVDVQRMVYACPTRGTALQAKRSLSAVLGYAVAEGVIERNPVAGRLELPPDVARAVGNVDVDPFAAIEGNCAVWDAETVLRAMPRLRDLPLESCWLCMVGAGLRREEALALTWRDVRVRGGVVELAVHRARTEKDGIKATKTARSVRVAAMVEPMGARLMELAGEPDELVCSASVGNISKRWANLWKERGKNCPHCSRKGVMLAEPAIPYLPLQRMRATHESLMQKAGVLDSVNAAAHGHSRAVSYKHYLSGDVRQATITLQVLLDGREGSKPPSGEDGSRQRLVRPGGFEPSTIGLEVRPFLSTYCRAIRGHAPKRDSYPKRKAPPTRR